MLTGGGRHEKDDKQNKFVSVPDIHSCFSLFLPLKITHPKAAPNELRFWYRAGRGFWVAVYSLVGRFF
jgi:hypothetical protein